MGAASGAFEERGGGVHCALPTSPNSPSSKRCPGPPSDMTVLFAFTVQDIGGVTSGHFRGICCLTLYIHPIDSRERPPVKPTGVAVSHCITWFQTQLIPTACQIRYHSHLWDHRSTGHL